MHMFICSFFLLIFIVIVELQPDSIPNYYETLEVSSNASKKEIEKAHKDLIRKYHPDRNPNNPEALERSQEINNAKDVLCDKVERSKHDKKLRESSRFRGIFKFGKSSTMPGAAPTTPEGAFKASGGASTSKQSSTMPGAAPTTPEGAFKASGGTSTSKQSSTMPGAAPTTPEGAFKASGGASTSKQSSTMPGAAPTTPEGAFKASGGTSTSKQSSTMPGAAPTTPEEAFKASGGTSTSKQSSTSSRGASSTHEGGASTSSCGDSSEGTQGGTSSQRSWSYPNFGSWSFPNFGSWSFPTSGNYFSVSTNNTTRIIIDGPSENFSSSSTKKSAQIDFKIFVFFGKILVQDKKNEVKQAKNLTISGDTNHLTIYGNNIIQSNCGKDEIIKAKSVKITVTRSEKLFLNHKRNYRYEFPKKFKELKSTGDISEIKGTSIKIEVRL